MIAVAFETDITSPFIEFKDYQRLLNKHVKVVVLVDDDTIEDQKTSFSLAGCLSRYANPELMVHEKDIAWQAVSSDKS
jgi:hypothetical protein